MKVKISMMFVIAVILTVSAVVAQPGRKVITSGIERFDPFGILGAPVGQLLDPGTVQCPGFEPTGDPLQPCPIGSRTHTRDTKWRSRFVSLTVGVSDGWFTVTANGNLDPDFTGPQWGTFSLLYDSGGTMDGTWQGVRYKDGDQWITPLHISAHVTGGPFDRAKVEGTDEIISYTPIPVAYIGTIETRVLVPR